MYNFYNSSTIYVSQIFGNDQKYSGLTPVPDEFGNGPFKTIQKALNSVGERRITGMNRPITIALTDDYYVSSPINTNCFKHPVNAPNIALDGITIESYGSRKRIIGGIKINDWKKDSFNGIECISAE